VTKHLRLSWERHLSKTGLLVSLLLLGSSTGVHAQVADRPLPAWRAAPLLSSAPLIPRRDTVATRSHTETGLLIGGIVGTAATTVFLIGFCSDPDTKCDIDEVGRALLVIALPSAALGALIGSLIRS
jgi:hypothetical protein